MRIFIDHASGQRNTARILELGIETRFPDVNIINRTRKEGLKDTQIDSVTLISDSTILIPIISNQFINTLSATINNTYALASENKMHYVFPLIYDDSPFSSFHWIVRSKVFPASGTPFMLLSEFERDREIGKIIQTIDNILHGTTSVLDSNFNKTSNYKQKIIFISHDHEDADFAELLKLQFEKNNIVSWIDSERLKIGKDWRQEIDDGIKNSLAVIAIMSPEAKKSEYVTYEWAFAWGKGIKIFPIMLKQTPLHPRLESLQFLDFTNRTTRPWDKLIQSIKELM